MTEDRLITAIGRLEKVIGRVEVGVQALGKTRVSPDDQLASRHRALQQSTGDAIERIDRLISVLDGN